MEGRQPCWGPELQLCWLLALNAALLGREEALWPRGSYKEQVSFLELHFGTS